MAPMGLLESVELWDLNHDAYNIHGVWKWIKIMRGNSIIDRSSSTTLYDILKP